MIFFRGVHADEPNGSQVFQGDGIPVGHGDTFVKMAIEMERFEQFIGNRFPLCIIGSGRAGESR